MTQLLDFFHLALACLLAGLFVHMMFSVSSKVKFFSRYNLTVVALCALYVAALIEVTCISGSGWVFAAGLVLPLAYAFLKANLEISQN